MMACNGRVIGRLNSKFVRTFSPFYLDRTLPCHGLLTCIGKTRTISIKYTNRHAWIEASGNDRKVGLTQYCQDAMGDVVYVALPDIGKKVEKYGDIGAIESAKAASEIYAPVTGTITGVNSNLTDNPGLINTSPHKDGWIFTMKPDNDSDVDKLMSEAEYKKFLKTENPL